MVERGWLIEGDDCYWNGKGTGRESFVQSARGAIRFSRQEDADIVRYGLLEQFAFALRVAEHLFEEVEPDGERSGGFVDLDGYHESSSSVGPQNPPKGAHPREFG